MHLSEALNRVIALGRTIRAYYDIELPRRHPNDPLVGPDDEETPPPPEEKELSDFLATLSEDMIYQMIFLIYLWRGEFRADDWAGFHEAVNLKVGNVEDARSYMMWYQTTLANELSEGLEILRQHKLNVDKWPSKKVKVRKR